MSQAIDSQATSPGPPGQRAGQVWAAVVSLVLVAVVLSPMMQNWREEPRDSFPLSYYPMFIRSRGENARVTYLVGVDDQGRRHRLHYAFVGTGGLNQVRKQINRLVRRGQAQTLCRIIAEGIAPLDGEPFTRLVEVQVVTGRYSLDNYFKGDRTPLSEQLRAAWPIARGQFRSEDPGRAGASGEPGP